MCREDQRNGFQGNSDLSKASLAQVGARAGQEIRVCAQHCWIPVPVPGSLLPTLTCSYSNSIPQAWPVLPFLATTVVSLPVSACSLSPCIYLSLCLYRLKHLGKFANRTKIATNGYYSYSTNSVPERPQDSLLLFPSSQQPCDGEDYVFIKSPFPFLLELHFPASPCYQVKSCD